MMIFLQIAGGLALLLFGGEVLVRGAVAVARHMGIPPLVIGLTIVAIGTSAPEIITGVYAALTGHPDIATGNIVGSNIANILCVLGLTALIFPIHIHRAIIRRDMPALFALTLIVTYFLWTGMVDRSEGIILIALFALYTAYIAHHSYKKSKTRHNTEIEDELPPDLGNLAAFAAIIGGIAMLAFGSDFMVKGASELARMLGISEAVIAVTLVAFGTSAPEIATCGIAAYRKHSDIAAGNVVGSNLVNIMLGLGSAALASPLPVATSIQYVDTWVMLGVTLCLFTVVILRGNISRLTGGVFFGGYILYILYQLTTING